MKKGERKIPKNKEEAIVEAKRFLKNAKEILSKAEIEYGRIYKDPKITREAV
jgi:dihydropteroate synthase